MIKLTRTEKPVEGKAFVAMPYGKKELANGDSFDFDELYREVYVPAVRECGMTPERADQMFGTTDGVFDAVWRGIQMAEVVIVDCSLRRADVAAELIMAMALGKRMVVLTQSLDEIVTDLAGRLRPIVYEVAGFGVATMTTKLKDQLRTAKNEAVTENDFVPLKGANTEPVTGTVVHVDKERAVVEVNCGGYRQLLELSNADVDYARLPDLARRYKAGESLDGAIATDPEGAMRYTMLADKSNPWPALDAEYPVGKVFTGRVVNMPEGVGAFVSVAHGIHGYVPFAEARRANITRDMDVQAEIVNIDRVKRKVTLRLVGRGPGPGPEPLGKDLPAVGDKLVGTVARIESTRENKGGFLLLRLKGYEQGPLAMLHVTKMTEDLRSDLQNGQVEMGEEISVEVLRVDPWRSRIDLGDVDDGDAGTSSAA